MATARAPAAPASSALGASRPPPLCASRRSLCGVARFVPSASLRPSAPLAPFAARARVPRAGARVCAARAAAPPAVPAALGTPGGAPGAPASWRRLGAPGAPASWRRPVPGAGRPAALLGLAARARAPNELFSVEESDAEGGGGGESGVPSSGSPSGGVVASSSSSSSSGGEVPVVPVAIIGSGPAGHTAAIYAGRACLSPVVFEGYSAGGPPGGQLTTTTEVENFPGFPEGVQGPDLMDRMRAQAARWGAVLLPEDVSRVDWSRRPFLVSGEETAVRAHAVVVATGARARKLGIPGEGAYFNRGVSACAICDGASPLFRGGRVAVVGGGDSACEEALYLTKYAAEVHLLVRSHALRASGAMAERVRRHPKVRVRFGVRVERALGANELDRRRTRDEQARGGEAQGGAGEAQGAVGVLAGEAQGGEAQGGAASGSPAEEAPADDLMAALVLRIENAHASKAHREGPEADGDAPEVPRSSPPSPPPPSSSRISVERFDGLFYGIGHEPNTSLLAGGGPELDAEGYVVTSNGPFTSLEGVFAAGDVQDTRWRQAVTAAGSGCMAALAAERWLSERGLLPERAEEAKEEREEEGAGDDGKAAREEEGAATATEREGAAVSSSFRAAAAATGTERDAKLAAPAAASAAAPPPPPAAASASAAAPPPPPAAASASAAAPPPPPAAASVSAAAPPPPPAAFDPSATFFEGEYALRRLYHESSSPLVVLYASPTCAPCRMLKPILRSAVEGMGGEVKMITVDLEASPHLARAAGVTATPTVQVFKRKALLSQTMGVKPKKYYRQAFQAAVEDREMAA